MWMRHLPGAPLLVPGQDPEPWEPLLRKPLAWQREAPPGPHTLPHVGLIFLISEGVTTLLRSYTQLSTHAA